VPREFGLGAVNLPATTHDLPLAHFQLPVRPISV